MEMKTFKEGAGRAAAMPEAWQGKAAMIRGGEVVFVVEHADRDEYARFSVDVRDLSAVVPDPSAGGISCILGVDGENGLLALFQTPWPVWTAGDEERLPGIVAELFPEPSVFGD